MKDFIEIITDFSVWVVYVISLLSTAILIITGTYEVIKELEFYKILYFLASAFSLGIHLILKIITRRE